MRHPDPVTLLNVCCWKCQGDILVMPDGTLICADDACTGPKVVPALVPASNFPDNAEGD